MKTLYRLLPIAPNNDDVSLPSSRFPSLKEPEPYENQDDEEQPRKGPVLLEQQLPVDAHGSAAILLAVVAQPAANLAHALKTVTTVQQVLDILGHDLGNIAQLIIQLVQPLRSTGIRIDSLSLGDEVVKLHEGVGPQGGRVHLGSGVRREELAGQVGQVCEGELARVRAVADAEEDDVRVDRVVQRVLRAAVDGGLGLRGAGELAQDLADLALDFGEGGFGLLQLFVRA